MYKTNAESKFYDCSERYEEWFEVFYIFSIITTIYFSDSYLYKKTIILSIYHAFYLK
jgi:hypothetical protein